MLRFAIRHGVVRLVGRRAMPALIAVDLIMLADRTRRIPVVDRSLRRGARAALDRADRVARAARSARGGPAA
jgi:hypothetical protein